MMNKQRTTESHIKLHEAPEPPTRSGGEARPFEFPHLYRIRAGDWRISYAVEHNRLAILVLEVLTPDGTPKTDPESEEIAQKMRVKLLELPDEVPGEEVSPEDVGKRLRIKLIDLSADMVKDVHGKGKIKLSGGKKPKITLIDLSPIPADEDSDDEKVTKAEKVTPLDSPTV